MATESAVQSWPLAPGPEALWLDEVLRGHSSTYNVPLGYRFDGAVSVQALQAAIDAIVDRHPVLASRIRLVDDVPVLVHDEGARCRVEVVNLISRGQDECDRAIGRFVSSPLSLEASPLIKVALFQLEQDASLLVLVLHHAVFDSWSLDVLLDDLSAAYRASRSGTEVQRGDSGGDTYTFATTGFARREDPALVEYWMKRLTGPPLESTWPLDRPRPDRPSYGGDVVTFRIPADLASAVRTMARTARTTPFIVFAAVLQVLLARVADSGSGQGDVVIGTPVALRDDAAAQQVIGYLANTTPLRLHVDLGATFVDVVRKATSDYRRDLSRAHYPFSNLIKRLALDRSPSRPPLVQVLIVVEDKPERPLLLEDLTGSPESLHTGTAKFDLTVTLVPHDGGYRGELEFSTDIYSADTAVTVVDSFVVLLRDALARPDVAVGDLAVVVPPTPSDDRNSSTGRFTHDAVLDRATSSPHSIALRWDHGQLTYSGLAQASERLSRRLRTAMSPTDDVVAVCARQTPSLAVAVLAILRASAGYVPLDPAYPRERLNFMLRDCGASLLLSDGSHRDTIDVPEHTRVMALDDVLDAVREDGPGNTPTEPHLADSPDAALCYVLYTSGSTGQPKGVEMPHGPLQNLLQWQAKRSNADQHWRTLQFAPISFDVAFQEIFSTWGSGGTLVLIDHDTRRDPVQLLDYLDRTEINRLFLPFVALQALAETASDLNQYPRHLKEVVTAGEQLIVTTAIRRFFLMTGASLENQYGPTETHVVTAERLPHPVDDWPELPAIGSAIDGVEVEVRDPNGQLLPAGVPGEIWVSGHAPARGYRGRPDMSAARFVVQNGTRNYRTGDIARRGHDGRIHYLGRRDGQVKIRGYRVETGEVEAKLNGQSGVADAVVVVHDRGRSGKQLVAHCIPTRGAHLTPQTLRSALAKELPDYMIPAAYNITPRFPLTPSGKVDRAALAQTVGTAATDRSPTNPDARDAVELQISAIWSQVLDRETPSVDDNFFEAGGDSFQCVRMTAAIRQTFSVELTVADIFTAPTVAALAELVRHGTPDRTHGPLVHIQTGNRRNPIYALHPLPGTVVRYAALARALGHTQPVWGLQSPGLHPGEAPLPSIDNMADHYLAHMRAVHTGTVWNLIGYSMGGVLAVEIARRLRDSGDHVGLVGLLDTNTSVDIDDDMDYATHILVRYGLRLEIDLQALLQLPPAERLQQLLTLGVDSGALPADYGEDRLQRMLAMYTHNGTALAAHTITPYDGDVVLFRAMDRSMEAHPAPADLGWRRLARHVAIRDVPGDHYHMMEPANVGALAAAILDYTEGDR